MQRHTLHKPNKTKPNHMQIVSNKGKTQNVCVTTLNNTQSAHQAQEFQMTIYTNDYKHGTLNSLFCKMLVIHSWEWVLPRRVFAMDVSVCEYASGCLSEVVGDWLTNHDKSEYKWERKKKSHWMNFKFALVFALRQNFRLSQQQLTQDNISWFLMDLVNSSDKCILTIGFGVAISSIENMLAKWCWF